MRTEHMITSRRSALSRLARTAAAILLAALMFAACSGGGKSKELLTEAQKANVIAAAEALFESGAVIDDENPLQLNDIDRFVYYIYNGELTAEEGKSYASVPEDEALRRIGAIFGAEMVLKTGRKAGTFQTYFAEDGKYWVLTNEPAAKEITIVSVAEGEDGTLTAKVSLTAEDGTKTMLELGLAIVGEDARVISCKRYEER